MRVNATISPTENSKSLKNINKWIAHVSLKEICVVPLKKYTKGMHWSHSQQEWCPFSMFNNHILHCCAADKRRHFPRRSYIKGVGSTFSAYCNIFPIQYVSNDNCRQLQFPIISIAYCWAFDKQWAWKLVICAYGVFIIRFSIQIPSKNLAAYHTSQENIELMEYQHLNCCNILQDPVFHSE